MILNTEDVRRRYRHLAPFYDLSLIPFRALGDRRNRSLAIQALKLRRGDTVVDLGCGTGMNIPLLVEQVGPNGRVIGVDLSAEMVSRAEQRVRRLGAENVELIVADLRKWEPPRRINAALATFALEMIPEYDDVVRSAARQLCPQGRLVCYGLKHPERWPNWLVALAIALLKPFGVSRDYESFRPWESMRHHLRLVEYREQMLGAAYVCSAEAPTP